MPQTSGERGALLHCLGRALSHERGPLEAGLGGGNDAADLWVPALESGKRPGDGGAVGPVLSVPSVVLGPADEIQQALARHEIMHEMATGTDPGLVAALQAE